MFWPTTLIAVLLLSNPAAEEARIWVQEAECSDQQINEIVQCAYRRFSEVDSQGGPAQYYVACGVGDDADNREPSAEFLSALLDSGVVVSAFSEYRKPPFSVPWSDAASASSVRAVRCHVTRIWVDPGFHEAGVSLRVHGAHNEFTRIQVGLVHYTWGWEAVDVIGDCTMLRTLWRQIVRDVQSPN